MMEGKNLTHEKKKERFNSIFKTSNLIQKLLSILLPILVPVPVPFYNPFYCPNNPIPVLNRTRARELSVFSPPERFDIFFQLFFGGRTLNTIPSENGSRLSTSSSSASPPSVIIFERSNISCKVKI